MRMMMKRQWQARGVLALTVGLWALVGCEQAVGPGERDPLENLAPGIHPVLVITGHEEVPTRVELHLKRVDVDGLIGSYQGELSYDVGGLVLAGAEIPPNLMGAWNEVETGRIRFAGAGVDGVGDAPVLVLRFLSAKPITADAFTLRIEEIRSPNDFADMTKRLVQHKRPLLTNRAL